MRIGPGLRVGLWRPYAGHWTKAFTPKGVYVGPDLGDHIVGTKLEQKLMEGDLRFRVGVLFRPDRSSRQRLETILILENYFEEMWEYDTWSVGETG